ncbi:MAG: roadblock/LC7 domain-containing protein [Burkholderiales bacterium]|jgi:predicted regulator of Ras-like GTPase activity (Roadblock/LC7/MglB family)|nr:roadblock/LC7 domain-containing protein [Burkholderiales bacterium]
MNALSKLQIAALQWRLNSCCEKAPEIQLILLATVDGFQLVVAGSQRNDTELPEKFAAIASSMTALSEAAGQELGTKKRLEAVALDLVDLWVILRMVNGDQEQRFVLAAVAEKKVGLGKLLRIVHDNALLLEEALR